MFSKARTIAVVATLLALATVQTTTQPSDPKSITTFEDQLGSSVGEDYFLASYAQLEEYWKQLDRESDRMTLVDIGRTEEGRTQWMAVITDPANAAHLERYKEISRRLARAEGLCRLDVGRDRKEILRTPRLGALGVGHRLLRGEGLGGDDEKRARRLCAFQRALEVPGIDVGGEAHVELSVGQRVGEQPRAEVGAAGAEVDDALELPGFFA